MKFYFYFFKKIIQAGPQARELLLIRDDPVK